jgi:hypothetical protein
MFRTHLTKKVFPFILFLSLALSLEAAPLNFDVDLSFGDESPEVHRLQQFLNSDAATRLAPSGPGSRGRETNYFGHITERAVKRFQELYASEILYPLGLGSATGYVGRSTRAKIKEILAKRKSDQASLYKLDSEILKALERVQRSRPLPGSSLDLAQIRYAKEDGGNQIVALIPYMLFPGENLIVDGWGFDLESNDVYIDGKYVRSFPSPDTRTLVLTIDSRQVKETDFKQHEIYIKSGNKTSNVASFVIGDPDKGDNVPVVDDFSPKIGPWGTTITIRGNNFLPTGNNVRTPLGTVRNVMSPDGQTLRVKLPDLSELPNTEEARANYVSRRGPGIAFYVVNDLGLRSKGLISVFGLVEETKTAPFIYDISPTHGPTGTLVRITGTNFVLNNNTVRTSIGDVSGLSSADGRTLEFAVPKFRDEGGVSTYNRDDYIAGHGATISFGVVNSNRGLTNLAYFGISDE